MILADNGRRRAILLAGGLGTRLRSVIADRPKPMAPVGDVPFLELLCRELTRDGITDLIFAVGYLGEQIEEYFGDGSRFGFRASYAYERELLGTAGAIKNAAGHAHKEAPGDRFLVLNADTFYRMNYGRLFSFAGEEGLEMALVLRKVPDITRYGEAVLTGTRLTGFNEKRGEVRPGTINGGVYLMTRELIDTIPEGKVSLENEMIPRWLSENRRLGGFVNDGYFIDIGVPEDYFRFAKDVEEGVIGW